MRPPKYVSSRLVRDLAYGFSLLWLSASTISAIAVWNGEISPPIVSPPADQHEQMRQFSRPGAHGLHSSFTLQFGRCSFRVDRVGCFSKSRVLSSVGAGRLRRRAHADHRVREFASKPQASLVCAFWSFFHFAETSIYLIAGWRSRRLLGNLAR